MRNVLLIALLAGCSEPPPPPTSTTIELRLRGINAGDYRALLVEVRDLAVSADGAPLKVEPGQVHLDLTDDAHAWLLGSVRVPDGAENLDARLELDDFGGFETVLESGDLDARSAIHFQVAIPREEQRIAQITALMDLSRSVVRTPTITRQLLPQLRVVR
jgi:hypothetical protein